MNYTSVRINEQDFEKIRQYCEEEKEKRGVHVPKSLVLHEIITDFFDKKNNTFLFKDDK